MTSNAGAQAIIDPKRLGFGNKENQEEDYKRMKMNVMNEIKLVFRPEFLNRIDEILVFHPLGEPELKKITGMMCQEVVKRAKEQLDIHLTVRDSVKKLIMEKGTDKKYGARPLRRAVQVNWKTVWPRQFSQVRLSVVRKSLLAYRKKK